VLCCSSSSTYTNKKELEEIPPNDEIEALVTARALVSVLNHSTQMLDKLKEIQVQRNVDENALGMTNDVVTHWWSTNTMIDRMLNLKSPIRKLYYEELDDGTRKDVYVMA
jgi:TusA-related sulfurtransferase